MLKKFLKLLLLFVVVLIIIVLVQTWRFTAPLKQTKSVAIPSLPDSAIQHLSAAIQIPTISVSDTLPADSVALRQFRAFIEKTYPLVHQKLQRIIIDSFSYIYYWPGKNTSLQPNVLMAHQDVVPVETATEKEWKAPPFSGQITDSAIWGRGAIDDKGNLISICEAAEKLLKQGYQPQRSFYLCFGHDEELGGSMGAAKIVVWMQHHNIHPALVCDEGGFITKENFKELGRPIALLGVAEKGYASFELTVDAEGGHSSMPAKETAIDILSKALVNIRSSQMPARFTEPTNEMLQKIGPAMPFVTRMALANRWLFNPMLISKFESSNGTNATIHSTIVPTIINAGMKDNVIPSHAEAVVNSRILPGETSSDVLDFLKKTINDDRVKIKNYGGVFEPGKSAAASSDGYKKVDSLTYTLMDNLVPVPFLMIGATDSRYFRNIADVVIDFTPMLDPKGFHGIDERMSISDYQRLVYYYEKMLQQ
ncbi:MAG: M20/M25/M40 family metallo-hydrolase [Bacteroidetes bacterium]|nr:M20/M25/M40 family metallo-hydrolase [Bacteroidota bacterium]